MPIENMEGSISGTQADEKAGFFLTDSFHQLQGQDS